MAIDLEIETVGGGAVQNGTVTVAIATPFTYQGRVRWNPNATEISAMSYQIDGGTVNPLPPPPNPGQGNWAVWEYVLYAEDIPSNGQYLLTVYAYYSDTGGNNSEGQTAFVTIQYTGG